MNFAIMINDFLTSFFKEQRGLLQGCALSQLLFILVMDCLRNKLKEEKDKYRIKGVKVSNNIYVIHMMFVDDMLFRGMDDNADWEVIH